MKTFKRSTILSAGRKSGLIPYNPEVVLSQIRPPESPQPATPLAPYHEIACDDDAITPANAKDLYTMYNWINHEEG
jgi:hypothetical protein